VSRVTSDNTVCGALGGHLVCSTVESDSLNITENVTQ